MSASRIQRVAVVGTGVVGRSWIYVFARAGCRTNVYDQDKSQLAKALVWMEETLSLDVADGFLTVADVDAIKARIMAADNLCQALSGAEYVQESGPEDLSAKKSMHKEIDDLADREAIVASSTSGLDINEIAAGLPGISRYVMVHPCNPPHVIPVVEVMPTRDTHHEVTERAINFLKNVGQKPVLVNFYVVDFLLNRIQNAVVREAIHLVERGVADVDAIDSVIRDGLGLRWALLGTFGVNNTNADRGIREYYSRFGESYIAGIEDLDPTPPSFSSEMIEHIARGVDIMEGRAPISEICRWRDRMVRRIRALKEADPHP